APLVVRNLAVPAANFGSGIGATLLMVGVLLSLPPLMWIGVILFSAVVFFQVVNLPVEFNASSRAREHLVEYGLITAQEEQYVAKVLNAAALTYVAATLQSIMTLAYYLLILTGGRRSD
ncbi:zinc metallopeptidase, partial [Rhodopirellula bahusiensis]